MRDLKHAMRAAKSTAACGRKSGRARVRRLRRISRHGCARPQVDKLQGRSYAQTYHFNRLGRSRWVAGRNSFMHAARRM